MRKLILLLPLLSACASSAIVPEGPDTFMILREGGSGFSQLGQLKVEAIREANKYCTESGKHFKIVRTNERPAGYGRFPAVEIGFMCLDKGDPELSRPKMAPVPDQVIEIRK